MISKMSLQIKNWRKIIEYTIYGALALLLLIFVIRVSVFEQNYYNEKEGSERAVLDIVSTDVELDEEKPNDAAVAEYKVAADRPRYLSIDKLSVKNARILPMGVNAAGELDTPRNIFDVGWYEASGKPGQGGTMIIDGHNGGPNVHGVFKNTPKLANGDIITIERGDGAKFNYRVVENVAVPLAESNAYMVTAAKSPEQGKESITLISCTGDWSQSQGTYLSRQFTRAVLTE